MNHKSRLITTIFWSNIILIVMILMVMTSIIVHIERRGTNEQIDRNISELAVVMSEEPLLRSAFENGSVTPETMRFLDTVIQEDSSVDYIVLADTDSVRLYHPDHSMIGKHFQGGDEGPALDGAEMYVTEGKGSRENQRRCFVSIKDAKGTVLGFIMVSRYSKSINELLAKDTKEIIVIFIVAAMISAVIAYIISKRIRKQLLGYEPSQIARMFLQREEVLDGLTEGILLVNNTGECEYANDAAGNLFGSRELHAIQPFVDTYAGDAVRSRTPVLQETIRFGDHTLLMDILPVWHSDVYAGSLIEISDKSDSVRMAAQLTGVDQIIGALRASTHETKNRMHVILGLLQIGEVNEAIDFIQSAAGYDEESDHIRDLIRNNTLAALLIGKRNRAKELGIDLRVRKDSFLSDKSRFLSSAELVTIVGNLLENSMDAIVEKGEKHGTVSLYITENEDMLMINVDDTGCGMDQGQIDLLMQGGYTTKGENHGIGMGLIRNIISGYNGVIDIDSEPGEGTSISITMKR